jgi:hypothetical protein
MEARAVIVGKGMTAIELRRADFPSATLVGINQSVVLVDDLDFLFANDVEGLEGLREEHMRRVRCLAVPEYPHFQGWSKTDVLHGRITNVWKGAVGRHVLYNLWTTPKKNPKLPVLDWSVSTSDTAISYLARHEGIRCFDLYGIGMGNGYHPKIMEILPKGHSQFANGWGLTRTAKLVDNINKLCKLHGITVNFH